VKPVKVQTRDRHALDEPPKIVTIDFEDQESRRWLFRHMSWALNHDHSVLVMKTKNEVDFTPKPAPKNPEKLHNFTREPRVVA
jgi:hypothetical protein